jgi:hypothetical protein
MGSPRTLTEFHLVSSQLEMERCLQYLVSSRVRSWRMLVWGRYVLPPIDHDKIFRCWPGANIDLGVSSVSLSLLVERQGLLHDRRWHAISVMSGRCAVLGIWILRKPRVSYSWSPQALRSRWSISLPRSSCRNPSVVGKLCTYPSRRDCMVSFAF